MAGRFFSIRDKDCTKCKDDKDGEGRGGRGGGLGWSIVSGTWGRPGLARFSWGLKDDKVHALLLKSTKTHLPTNKENHLKAPTSPNRLPNPPPHRLLKTAVLPYTNPVRHPRALFRHPNELRLDNRARGPVAQPRFDDGVAHEAPLLHVKGAVFRSLRGSCFVENKAERAEEFGREGNDVVGFVACDVVSEQGEVGHVEREAWDGGSGGFVRFLER